MLSPRKTWTRFDARHSFNLRAPRQTVPKGPALNKGMAFTPEERRKYGLEGFPPSAVDTLDRQVSPVLEHQPREGGRAWRRR